MEFQLHYLFGDHMLFQQQSPITVLGTATSGAIVAVEIATSSATASADAEGKWKVTLPGLSAGGPHELRATSGEKSLILKDVLIGEVWVCSGQSNMDATVEDAPDAESVLREAHWPQVRLLKLPRIAHPIPPEHVEAGWKVCSPTTAGAFSKVAYHHGISLHKTLEVPIGLIDVAQGGTYLENWTPREELYADPEMRPIVAEYEESLSRHRELAIEYQRQQEMWRPPTDPGNNGHPQGWADLTLDDRKWPSMTLPCWWQYGGLRFHGVVWFRKTIEIPEHLAGHDLTLSLGACDKADITYFNNIEVGSIPIDFPDGWRAPRLYKIPGGLVRPGRNVIAVRVFCNVYQGGMTGPAQIMKIHTANWSLPLEGLWQYQVEHNFGWVTPPARLMGPGNINSPYILFHSLIVPILIFRIRGVIWYQGESDEHQPDRYARLFPAMIRGWRRAWQQGDFPFLFVQLPNFGPEEPATLFWTKIRHAQEATLAVPNTAMVPTIDIGDPNDLHPTNKDKVGHRLSLAALALAYHLEDPTIVSPYVESVTFDGSCVRLEISPRECGLCSKGEMVEGFALAGIDGAFLPSHGRIESSRIVVWNDSIPVPRSVCYAWADNPRNNIINSRGLPLRPFHSSFRL